MDKTANQQKLRLRAAWRRAPIPVALLALFVLLFAGARPALAHAVLVRSDPAANAKLPNSPKLISLYFSEPVEPRFSSVKVVNGDGAELDQHDSRVDAGDPTHMTVDVQTLKPGFYSVVWVTVSKIDGHELRGSYPFIVLNPNGSVPAGTAAAISSGGSSSTAVGPADAAVFWMSVLGAVGLFGGMIFALAVMLPAARVLGDESEAMRARGMRVLCRLLWLALAVFLLGEIGVLLLDLSHLGGLSNASSFLTGTSFGQYGVARIFLGVLVACVLLLLTFFDSAETRAPLVTLLTLCTAGILVCFALTSHAAAIGDGSFWATVSDLLHLATVGIWVGGLIGLITLLWISRRLPRAGRIRFQAMMVGRFSPLAAVSVALIVLSGAFNALVEVPAWQGLWTTGYGRTLLVKIGLVALLLAVGAINAFYLRPRLIDAAGESSGGSLEAAMRLQRRLLQSVGAETGLAVAVLAATALLAVLIPARGELAAAKKAAPQANGSSVYQNTTVANDLGVQLRVDPNRVGLNTFTIRLSGHDGPVSNATLVRLQFTFADPRFGQSEIVLPSIGDGVYQAQGANFAQVGHWQVATVIRRTGKDDALTSFTVEVPDAAGNLTVNRVNASDPFASPTKLFSMNQLGGILLVLLGVLPFVLYRRLWNRGATAGALGTFFGFGAVILGATIFFAARSQGTIDYTLLTNPVPVTNSSVADGKMLYFANCAICHGDTGHGDGPAAKSLNPQPVDLTVHVGLHADGVLWGWISYGIPRTAMPAWQAKLTATQRWDIVNFLRTAFQASGASPPPAPNRLAAKASSPADAAAAAWAAMLSAGGPHASQ